MSILDKLYIKWFCICKGEDEFGNRYYLSQKTDYLGRQKRFVIYNGRIESSKVPPMWHAWLHYLNDQIPLQGKISKYKWQKDHMPNMTGTPFAYFPTGHKMKDGIRDRVSSDYEPWQASITKDSKNEI